MNFQEAGACGINKRKFEISMNDKEREEFDAFLKWYGDRGNDPEKIRIPWAEDKNADGENHVETSEDLFAPMFQILDNICDDIPDEAEYKPLVEEMTDEMAAYFEG